MSSSQCVELAARHRQRAASARRRRRRWRTGRGTAPASRSPPSAARDLLRASARCRAGRPGLPSEPAPSGSRLQVDVDRPGQRVGDHQRRRGEVVGQGQRVDAAFEVAVAAQHRGRDQIALLDRRADRLRQRPAVADAGRAAVADQVEAQRLQRRQQAGRRAGSRSPPSSPAPGWSSPTASRAGRARPPSSPAARPPSITDGLEVLVQLVIAAITTAPCVSCIARRRRAAPATACLVEVARSRP